MKQYFLRNNRAIENGPMEILSMRDNLGKCLWCEETDMDYNTRRLVAENVNIIMKKHITLTQVLHHIIEMF